MFTISSLEPISSEVLSDRVAECDALVAIIGKDWVTATDESNQRRLDDPNDYVRIELGTALQRDIPVIPVLVGGAVMPRQESLPEMLKPLTRRQGLAISNANFDTDSERLTKALAFVEEARQKREEAAELVDRQGREAEASKRGEDERRVRDEAKSIGDERKQQPAQADFQSEQPKREEAESARRIDLPKSGKSSARWPLIGAAACVALAGAAAFSMWEWAGDT